MTRSLADRSKTRCAAPRLRLLCFTNAGNEEGVFTQEGLGARKVRLRTNAPPGRCCSALS